MFKIRLLSLIVPAYKQEKIIVKDIKNIDKILSSLPFLHELIVVRDLFLAIHIALLILLRALLPKNISLHKYEKTN